MLDFLKEADISDATIDYILNNFSNNDLMSLVDNEEECLKTISLLRKLGIENIEDLLMYESYVFMKLSNRVLEEMSKYDISQIVLEINDDYSYIEKIV